MHAAIEKEVTELHQFFEDWFHGGLPDTDEAFARFAQVMGPDLLFVAPDGRQIKRDDLVAGLRGAHGKRAGVKIGVAKVTSRKIGTDLWLVTYEEHQQTGEEKSVRISTAVMRASTGQPNGLVWEHVHETWIKQ